MIGEGGPQCCFRAAPEPFTVSDRPRHAAVRTPRSSSARIGHACSATDDGTTAPAMSIVYYIPTDDGELLVSTHGRARQGNVVARDGKVNLCILDERWPFRLLTGLRRRRHQARSSPDRGRDDGGRRAHVRSAASEEEARPTVEAMARRREPRGGALPAPTPHSRSRLGTCTETIPGEKITHWLSGTVPWDAPDWRSQSAPTLVSITLMREGCAAWPATSNRR